jgi:hypothetical protein
MLKYDGGGGYSTYFTNILPNICRYSHMCVREGKLKVKLPLCVTKHRATKTDGEVEV